MDILKLRTWQYTQMENGLKTMTAFVRVTPSADLTSYKDGGTGWTVVQVLCHLRDFEAVFLERMRLMETQDNPALPFPQPDALAAEKAYADQNVHEVLREFAANRAAYLEYMKGLDESVWERKGIHPVRGEFTPHDQLFLTTHHDILHLEQMTRILAEKKA